jgi:hypothetical protein
MEIIENSFSLRGVSGLVKVVSDSAFDPESGSGNYSDEAECDVIVESNGFRVNKVVRLSMPGVAEFLHELRSLLEHGEGSARLNNAGDELTLAFIFEKGQARVECAMNDAVERKENFVHVKYPIEPDYLAVLKRDLAKKGKSPKMAD